MGALEEAIADRTRWGVDGRIPSAPRRRRFVEQSAAMRRRRGEELLRRMQPEGWDEV